MIVHRIGLLSASLAALALTASAASAQDTETGADLRCLVVTVAMSQSQDATIKAIGLAGAAYYLGRLDARDPKLDLENRLVEEAGKMKAEGGGQAEAMTCVSTVTSRGQAVGEIVRRAMDRLKPPAAAAPAPHP